MGVYDTIIMPCPECGELYHAQSKGSGDRSLRVFELTFCPLDVLSDANRRAPFTCENCGTNFEVETRVMASTVKVDY